MQKVKSLEEASIFDDQSQRSISPPTNHKSPSIRFDQSPAPPIASFLKTSKVFSFIFQDFLLLLFLARPLWTFSDLVNLVQPVSVYIRHKRFRILLFANRTASFCFGTERNRNVWTWTFYGSNAYAALQKSMISSDFFIAFSLIQDETNLDMKMIEELRNFYLQSVRNIQQDVESYTKSMRQKCDQEIRFVRRKLLVNAF